MKIASKKAGLPPGSLVYIGDKISKEIKISMVEYDTQTLVVRDDISIAECLKYLKTPSLTWINICGIHDSAILNAVGTQFGLHGLLLEDVMNTTQRPKLDDYKDHIFIVLRALMLEANGEKLDDTQVSIVLGKNYLITFMENCQNIFTSVKDRIVAGNERIRSSGTDYLCYALIDSIVDQYFIILEEMDQKLDDLEKKLLVHSGPSVMHRIQHVKKEIILLRKSVWPTREVINNFQKLDSPLVSLTTRPYMQDVYDHTIQAIDTIESFRDLSSGMLDVYLSNMSQRLNEIMKVLTVVSTIFVPLTFIASIYGMNFDYMPELRWKWGYALTLGIMATVASGMLLFFRRKKWI